MSDFVEKLDGFKKKADKYVKDNFSSIMADRPDSISEGTYGSLAEGYHFWKYATATVVGALNGASDEDIIEMLEHFNKEFDDDVCRQAADEVVRGGVFSALSNVIDRDPAGLYRKLTSESTPKDWKLGGDSDADSDAESDAKVLSISIGLTLKIMVSATRGPKLAKPEIASGRGLYTTELIKSGLIDKLVNLYADVPRERWGSGETKELSTMVVVTVAIIAELTVKSKAAVTEYGKIFPLLIQQLRDASDRIQRADASDSDSDDMDDVQWPVFLMMRLAQYPPAQAILNQNGVMDIMERLLPKVEDEMRQIVIVSAASLGGDEFSKKFKCDESTLDIFVELLNDASDPNWAPEALTLRDVCGAISALSENEENKKILLGLNIHEPALKILKHKNCRHFHDAIKADIASILMNLSFDDEVREELEAKGVVEALKEVKALKPSERDAVEEHDANDFVNAVDGALFNFGVREEKKIDPVANGQGANDEKPPGHIMISYNWSHKPLALFLNEQLKARGYRVWIDVESMAGDAVEAMAEAVEGSTAVLWIATSAYKQSPNCQLEAKYSNKLRKPIVPIMAEPGYRPDGWLGLIIGDKLYFNFRDEGIWEDSIELLDKEIEKYRNGSPSAAAPASNQVAPAPAGGSPLKRQLTQSDRIDLLLGEMAALREDVAQIKANQCSCTLQ